MNNGSSPRAVKEKIEKAMNIAKVKTNEAVMKPPAAPANPAVPEPPMPPGGGLPAPSISTVGGPPEMPAAPEGQKMPRPRIGYAPIGRHR